MICEHRPHKAVFSFDITEYLQYNKTKITQKGGERR